MCLFLWLIFSECFFCPAILYGEGYHEHFGIVRWNITYKGMTTSATKSINGTSDISCVSEYWYENGDNPAVFYGQSPDTTVDKTPNIPWEKKKNKKVEKCIKDLTRELLI
ncbi:unnamed protein product [Rhizophagus irregularis]|nr:unnamed protein product [Rhizophagus irregularis]